MNKTVALAVAETRLVLRNKTVAISSILLPIALGLLWAYTFRGSETPFGMVAGLQLAVILGMGVYVTATTTVVARRHNHVLKRMRTSGLTDAQLLTATVAPAVAIGIVQLVIFAVIDGATGIPLPADPLALILAAVGGLALMVTAALATAVVTPSPERAQITTLPLVFLLLGLPILLVFAPSGGWWQALSMIPGAAMGELTDLAFAGGLWPGGLIALAALIVWPVVFAALAMRRFRWDPRR